MVLGPGKLPGSVTGAESTSGATLVIFSWFNWFVVPPVFCTATIAVAMPELSVSVATSIGELARTAGEGGEAGDAGAGKGRKGRAVPPPKVHERAAGRARATTMLSMGVEVSCATASDTPPVNVREDVLKG